jgi:hypothetical protein
MTDERPDATDRRTAAGPRHRRIPGVNAQAARLVAESALIGLLIGVAVVAPWTRRGYLVLLDWVSGPNQALTPGLYGLDAAALDALPYRLITQMLRETVGAGATSWLMVLAYFPIAAGGVSALAGGGRWRRHPAGLLVCVNPFVIERLQAGHVPFLLSVALLCPMLASAVHARRRGTWFAARPAGWYALAMSIGPHAAWLGGAGLLAVALLPRPRWRDLARTAVVVASAGCVYAYAVAVLATAILTVRVGSEDLEVYATLPGPDGLFRTLLTLRGFWRGAAESTPTVTLSAAPAAMMVLAAVTGLVLLSRRDRAAGVPMMALTVAGLLLGAGVRGPLGPVYRAAFDHLPLFTAMREQQKWVALAMIGYAVGTGVTVEALAAACRRGRAVATGVVAAGTVAALGVMCASIGSYLVWGLGGSIRVAHYPSSWYAADRLMGEGTESVLFLPWHQYQPFAFTGSRTVATPAGAFFRRPVISSDAAEVGLVRSNSTSRRTAYLDRLLATGDNRRFGRLVAPLGVGYVALARDREAEEYAWLEDQLDLAPMLRTREFDLYRVTVAGTGRVGGARDGDADEAFAWAAEGVLGTEAVLPGVAGRGPVPSAAWGGIRRTSSTSWQVEAGGPGWVVLPEEWSSGWAAEGRRTSPTVAGTVAVDAGTERFDVRYTPWKWLRLGLAASLVSLVVLLVAGLVEHRRELSGWWSGLRVEVRRPGRRRAPSWSRRRGGTARASCGRR